MTTKEEKEMIEVIKDLASSIDEEPWSSLAAPYLAVGLKARKEMTDAVRDKVSRLFDLLPNVSEEDKAEYLTTGIYFNIQDIYDLLELLFVRTQQKVALDLINVIDSYSYPQASLTYLRNKIIKDYRLPSEKVDKQI